MIYALLSLPLWLSIIIRTMLKGNFDFDCDNVHGSFLQLYVHYSRQAYLIVILSLVGAVFSASFKLITAAILLTGSGIYALLFIVILAYFYESFLHLRYPNRWNNPQHRDNPETVYIGPSNYSATRYAIVQGLGFGSLILFIAGVVTLMLSVSGV